MDPSKTTHADAYEAAKAAWVAAFNDPHATDDAKLAARAAFMQAAGAVIAELVDGP